MDPSKRLSSQDEKARYELHNNNPSDIGYQQFLNQLINPLKDRLRKGVRGLDYGCGPGPTVQSLMAQEGFDVNRFDPYFFPDTSVLTIRYDFITATEVLEHLYEPRKTLNEINNLLKPGGMLGVMTLLYDKSIPFETWWYQKDPTHVVFYQAETIQKISEIFGWRCEILKNNVILFRKRKS